MEHGTERVHVFDFHSDIATDLEYRRARGERQVFERHHYPRLVKAGVKAMVCVLWVEPEHRHRSADRVVELHNAMMDDFAESSEVVEIVTDAASLERVMGTDKVAVFLGVEGMTFVEQWSLDGTGHGNGNGNRPGNEQMDSTTLQEKLTDSLDFLGKSGLRHSILVWGEHNQIASGPGGVYKPELSVGLTPFGTQVVRELQSRGVVVDLSHLDDDSIDGVLAVSEGPIIASHSNARALCNVPRNLIDRHIREIGRRDGVIGLNAYTGFIDEQAPTLDRFIDHLVYIADMIGIEHVALGFDFMDYLGYVDLADVNNVPRDFELRGVDGVPRFIERLRERGFSDRDIEQVAFTNAVRMMTDHVKIGG